MTQTSLFTEVNGLTAHYTDRGAGDTTVLLLHGFGGDLENWLFNLEALAQHHRVVALDLPGHGQSTKALPDSTLAGLADWVQQFVKAVGLSSFHLVGHSMGGALAQLLTQQAPESVQSLTLIGSAGLGPELNEAFLDGLVAAQTEEELKPVLEWLFATPGLVSAPVVAAILAYKLQEGVEPALRTLANALKAHQAESPPPQEFPVPTLVLWGQEDAIVPVAQAQALPGAEVTVWEQAGHLVQMERAADVNARLLAFWESVSAEHQSA